MEILEAAFYSFLAFCGLLAFNVLGNAVWDAIKRFAPRLPGAFVSHISNLIAREEERVRFLAAHPTLLVCEGYKVLMGVCCFAAAAIVYATMSLWYQLIRAVQDKTDDLLAYKVICIAALSGAICIYFWFKTYNRALNVRKAIREYERRLRERAPCNAESPGA